MPRPRSAFGLVWKATTYFPVIELLKSYFGIERRDDTRNIRQKVAVKLSSLDRALEPDLPPFLWLLDVPPEDANWDHLDPLLRRPRLLEAIRRLLLRESQVQPLIVVCRGPPLDRRGKPGAPR